MSKKIDNIFLKILMILVVIQPILDLIWLNDGSISEIFGFTIPTLIRFSFVLILAVLSFFVIKFNKNYLCLVAYIIVIGIYFIFHHLNGMQFTSLVPGNFNYSIMGEIFYFLRMLIPISVIYFTYNSNISSNYFTRCVLIVSLTISLTVIISNLFYFSLGSYTTKPIGGNIIDWFVHYGDYVYTQIASKGLFNSSITSTVLVLTFPYIIYLFIDTKKRYFIWIIIAQSIALIMFGTKATSFSVIIELFCMLLVYLFCSIFLKQIKIDRFILISLLLLLIGNGVLYQFGPSSVRVKFDKQYSQEIDKNDPAKSKNGKDLNITKDPESIIMFLDKNYKKVSISSEYLKSSYPYKYDPLFWYEILEKTTPSIRMQNRIMQEAMFQRIKEINNNPMDNLVGIGYSRSTHIYNIERDFIFQYYSSGIIGIIVFIGPYVSIVGIGIIYMLLKFKEKLNILNCSIILGVGLSLFVAFYGGNVLENLGITIILGFLLGYLLKVNIKSEKV
ncbi:MAG: O-antigen ligase family protein [Erysipelotrichaceae bacterium]